MVTFNTRTTQSPTPTPPHPTPHTKKHRNGKQYQFLLGKYPLGRAHFKDFEDISDSNIKQISGADLSSSERNTLSNPHDWRDVPAAMEQSNTHPHVLVLSPLYHQFIIFNICISGVSGINHIILSHVVIVASKYLFTTIHRNDIMVYGSP